MPVIPRTRFNSLERIAGMRPCLYPALRLKKEKKIYSRTDVRNRSGWSCAFYVETSTSCSQRKNEGGRRQSQSTSRDAEFPPITSSQVRDYRSSSATEWTAQRFSCKSWNGATIGWHRGPPSRKRRRWVFMKTILNIIFMSWRVETHSRLGSSSATSGAFKLLPALTRPTSQVAF